jgi:tellurite resistance protein
MYLALLNREEQQLFLELASIVANVDEEFSDEEAQLIELFRKEMNLPEKEYPIQNIGLTKILEKFGKSTSASQRMIFIEILGLVYADDSLHENEKDLLEKLKMRFSIDEKEEKSVTIALKELSEAYKKLGAFVAG